MSAKCELCGDLATVHEVSVQNGVGVERNLCERCAALAGLGGGVKSTPTKLPEDVHDLIKEFLSQSEKQEENTVTHNLTITQTQAGTNITFTGAVPGRSANCRGCGMSYADFKKSGLLGCAECYVSFEPAIGPLIERAQEGGVHHTGKHPPNTKTSPEKEQTLSPQAVLRSAPVRTLCKRLMIALKEENYRQAASLRDQLRLAVPDGCYEQVMADLSSYAADPSDDTNSSKDTKGGAE